MRHYSSPLCNLMASKYVQIKAKRDLCKGFFQSVIPQISAIFMNSLGIKSDLITLFQLLPLKTMPQGCALHLSGGCAIASVGEFP